MRRKAAWVGSKPSRVITLGLAVALESLTEEGLGGGDVTRSTEVGFDGFALFINSAVEVHPLTAYLEVGLVYAPGIADRPLVGLPTFLELWDVASAGCLIDRPRAWRRRLRR